VAKSKQGKKTGKKGGLNLAGEDRARAEAWWQGLEGDPQAALTQLEETARTEPDLAWAMLSGLAARPGPGAGWLAVRAGEGLSSKNLRKAAKKAVYQLRQKGLEVEEAGQEAPLFKPIRIEPAQALMTGVFPDGTELVLLVFPRLGGEGICGGLIMDVEGRIKEASLAPMRLSQFREMISQANANSPWPPVKIEGPDLVWFLGAVVGRHREQSGDFGQEMTFLSQWLKSQSSTPESAPIYGRLGVDPSAEPQPSLLLKLKELLDDPPCLFWEPDPERWAQVKDRINEGSQSNLILTPDLEHERWDKALASAADELFLPETRPAWRFRLEATALFLASSGREDEARVFLAQATGLDRGRQTLFPALVERQLAWEEAGEEEEPDRLIEPAGSGRLIISPDEAKELS